MKINPLVMLESDLLALRSLAVLARCFPFTVAVRIAAAMRLSKCEVLLTRYAAAPDQGQDEKQRKK